MDSFREESVKDFLGVDCWIAHVLDISLDVVGPGNEMDVSGRTFSFEFENLEECRDCISDDGVVSSRGTALIGELARWSVTHLLDFEKSSGGV